jgi:hypothetical protein
VACAKRAQHRGLRLLPLHPRDLLALDRTENASAPNHPDG